MQEPGGRYTRAATKLLFYLKDSMMISNDLNTGEETILGEKDFLHRKPTPPSKPVHLGFWIKV